MRERVHVRLVANPAFAGKPPARLDHQLVTQNLALHFTVGQDFQARTFDLSLYMTADHQVVGFDLTFEAAFVADRDVGSRFDRALDAAVDVEVVL